MSFESIAKTKEKQQVEHHETNCCLADVCLARHRNDGKHGSVDGDDLASIVAYRAESLFGNGSAGTIYFILVHFFAVARSIERLDVETKKQNVLTNSRRKKEEGAPKATGHLSSSLGITFSVFAPNDAVVATIREHGCCVKIRER